MHKQTLSGAWQFRQAELLARSVTPFVANKHLELCAPGLEVSTRPDGQTLYVEACARSLARFVEFSIEGVDAIFSDNYLDIPAGTTVTITTPRPETWTHESTVHVRSLADSF